MAARLEDMDEVALAAAARARSNPGSCAVVLVEGMSDQAAVQTLAERAGRDLRAEGVFVVPMGGATNIGHFADLFGPGRYGVRPHARPPVRGVSPCPMCSVPFCSVSFCRAAAGSPALVGGPRMGARARARHLPDG